MGIRVTGVHAALLAILVLVGLTNFGFSRGIGEETDILGIGTGIFSPSLPHVGTGAQIVAGQKFSLRNYENAEIGLTYVSDTDVSTLRETLVSPKQKIVLSELITQESDADQRAAYGEYLASLQAAQTDLLLNRPAPARHSELSGSVVTTGEGNLLVVSAGPLDIKPEFMDLVAPVPHIRGLGIPVEISSSSMMPDEISVAFAAPANIAPVLVVPVLVVPVPAPASARPVFVVKPLSVAAVQPARDVSVDRLVHVDVTGSWPRRLDQINSLAQGDVLIENWNQSRQQSAKSYSQLPSGYILVSNNN